MTTAFDRPGSEPYPRTWAEIDLAALGRNLALVRSRLGDEPVQIAIVTKADAYGHGLVPVSRYASTHGAEWIAVATVQEGIALRDAGLECPVMVMSPILPVESDQAVFYGLDIFVERYETGVALSKAAVEQGRSVRLHLKVDTGLHRFGCGPAEAAEIGYSLKQLPQVELVGLAQHFANSAGDPEYTKFQMRQFQLALIECAKKGVRFEINQMANSAGAVKYPQSRGSLVRIGILAYGIDPFNLLDGEATPVMSWYARVTSVRALLPGSKVGYDGTFTASRHSVIATVGVGYGDGYPRNLSNCGSVFLHGRMANVVGRVCMDQLMVDVTDVPEAQVGDTVELLGLNVRAESLAKASDTNAHEIVTRLMSRVPRRYLYS